MSRIVEPIAAARARRAGAVVVLHTPWATVGPGFVKELRRHLHVDRVPVFEGHARPDGATYRPLREVVSLWSRNLDDLGLVDGDITTGLDRVGDALGLASARHGGRGGADRADAGQLLFFEAVGRLLVAMSRRLPGVVLWHDFHLADSTTRAAMSWVLENVATDPVARFAPSPGRSTGFDTVVVVTTSERGGTLDDLRDRLGDRENVTFVDLRDIEEAEVRAWAQSDEVVERLMEASGGSVDQLRELLDALPRRVEDLYLRRVERRPREDRPVLEALAVLGRPVKPDFLLRVAELEGDPPSLSALADARLIERRVNRGELLVDFPSPDNREAVYTAMDEQRRRRLHGRVAGLLEERSRLGESVDIETIAHHYLNSDVDDKAVQYALDAAERLHIAWAWQRALEVLEALLPRVEAPDVRAIVLERQTDLYASLTDHEAALGALDAWQALVREDPSALARVRRRRGEMHLEMGSYDEALDDVGAARTALAAVAEAGEDAGDPRLPLELAALEAEAHYGLGDYDEAVAVAESALAESDVPADLALRLSNTRGKVHLFVGRYDEATETFSANQTLARSAVLPREEVRALFNLGTIALQRRQYDDAERIFDECMRFGAETSNPITRSFLQLNLGVVYHKTLRYAEALDAYLSSLGMFRQSGNDLQFAVCAMNLGSLYHTLGVVDRARDLLQSSIAVTSHREMKYFHGRALFVLGNLELDDGRPSEAAMAFEQAGELLGRTGSTFAGRLQVGLARAAHALGNHAWRDALLADLDLPGDEGENAEVRADASLYGGWFALHDGRTGAAVERLEAALLTFEKHELHERVWQARVWLALARAAEDDARGALRAARGALDLVRHIAEQVPDALRDTWLHSGGRREVAAVVESLEAGETPSVHPAVRVDEAAASTDPAWLRWRARYPSIVGEDPRLMQILRVVDRISASDSTVLIQGESGTGKELIAEAIHQHSQRDAGPFVKVNCAAFVETLLLSELFGHERGAFTGAMGVRKGRFELAHGGTLFLDEIGDISPNTQVALLRVLQEKTFERVGGSDTIEVDVRLICATNRNLEEMVRAGAFRLDLYYRLKGVVIELPPLSDRRSDIPRLVEHFCDQFAKEGGRRRQFSRDALAWLVRYSWPGNIRELENFVRSMLLFVDGDRVELANVRQFDDFFADGAFVDEMPGAFDAWVEAARADAPVVPASAAPGEDADEALPDGGSMEGRIAAWALDAGVGLPDLRKRLEAELIRQALVEAEGNVSRAARLLDMKRPRLSQIINGDEGLSALKDELTSRGTG